jgi:hypothetical protein
MASPAARNSPHGWIILDLVDTHWEALGSPERTSLLSGLMTHFDESAHELFSFRASEVLGRRGDPIEIARWIDDDMQRWRPLTRACAIHAIGELLPRASGDRVLKNSLHRVLKAASEDVEGNVRHEAAIVLAEMDASSGTAE